MGFTVVRALSGNSQLSVLGIDMSQLQMIVEIIISLDSDTH